MRTAVWSLALGGILTAGLWARGGDGMAEVRATARRMAAHAAPVEWEVPVDYEAADLIEEIAPGRLLVGTVRVGGRLGVPRHGPLVCVDARSGEPLWEAGRPARTDGEYRLLASAPSLLLLGTDDRRVDLTALDPRTGRTRATWRGAAPARLAAAGDALLVLSAGGRALTSLDPGTLRERWSRQLTEEGNPLARELVSVDEVVVVLGARARAYASVDGEPRWTLEHAALAEGAAGAPGAGDLLLWSAGHTLRVDPRRGAVRWERPGEELRAVQVLGDQVLRVGGGGGGDRLEALDLATGHPRWTRDLEDRVVGPLAASGELLLASGESAVLGVRARTGGVAFRTPLPPSFVEASPRRAPRLGLPDLLLPLGGGVVLHRELAGLVRLSLPSGDLEWTQAPFRGRPEYPANDATLLQELRAELTGQGGPPAGGVARYDRPGPNPFLRAAERQHEDVMARTGRVLSSPGASLGDRQAAIETRGMSARLTAAQQEVAMAGERMQAGVAVASSIMALGAAIKERQQRIAQEGLWQRMSMLARAALRLRERAFQGRYFLDPFVAKGDGMGLTLVDLETGHRVDRLYSPLVLPLIEYGLDLLAFALGSGGRRLYTLGLGFEPTRWKTVRKWRRVFPSRALLALDVGALRFAEDSPLREARARAAARVPTGAALVAALEAVDPRTQALVNAAVTGDAARIRALLAEGVDPDGTEANGFTALHMAVMIGKPECVDALLQGGADPRKPDAFSKLPLEYAAGDDPVKRRIQALLRAAMGKE